MHTRRCLLLDDDAIAATFIAGLLRAQDIAVVHVATLAAAPVALNDRPCDWWLVDRHLPDGDGMAWLQQRLERGGAPAPARCLITSGDAIPATELPPGVAALRKPIDADALLAWFDDAPAAVATPAERIATSTLPLLEDAAATQRLGGRRESLLALREMLRKELITGASWQAQLGEASARPQSLAQLHRLRAACALTGCLRLAEYSTVIDELMRRGGLPAPTLHDAFRQCLSDTISQITLLS